MRQNKYNGHCEHQRSLCILTARHTESVGLTVKDVTRDVSLERCRDTAAVSNDKQNASRIQSM